ncbi:MAG TPA: NADH-quinone oxidoreductase subunit C [Blastocatellia bacterium]|nr:NADH-quinone oxidoreductase subunit C [Blastocatellia bacterium]
MIEVNLVARQLRAVALSLADIEVRTSREVRVSCRRENIPVLADYLRDRFNARPELILAEDARAECGQFRLRYIFEIEGADVFVVVTTETPADDATIPSLATRWYQASRFEREIHDLFGLVPVDHPDLRRLPLHQFWPADYYPLQRTPPPQREFVDDGTPYPFRRVEGEGIHEITVGPVHAGIIEPGHFRFSVEGETIINLESRLYFVHKGIEKLFEEVAFSRAVALAERISGDSSVAHAMAFCQAIESLAGVTIPARAAYLRVVLLELERIYNHIADIGAICTDTGFAFANAHAMRIRENMVRLNARLTGHRLLRGTLEPGGVRIDLSQGQIADAQATLAQVNADFEEVADIALKNNLVVDRLQGTGRLTTRTAREMQVVGLVARASGIDADARRDHPFAAYGDLPFRVAVLRAGDVWARFMVRAEELHESFGLVARALDRLPEGSLAASIREIPVGASSFGLVEGWRGPIWHWVVAGANGSLSRVKIKDASFANWPALNYAILKNIVPDFPLVNKSFNLSYAGNDL